jgi:hypothetical protein
VPDEKGNAWGSASGESAPASHHPAEDTGSGVVPETLGCRDVLGTTVFPILAPRLKVLGVQQRITAGVISGEASRISREWKKEQSGSNAEKPFRWLRDRRPMARERPFPTRGNLCVGDLLCGVEKTCGKVKKILARGRFADILFKHQGMCGNSFLAVRGQTVMLSSVVSEVDFIEELRLRRWAREHFVPRNEREMSWHPVILDEMDRKDREMTEVESVCTCA